MKKTHFYKYYLLFFAVACLFILTFNQIYIALLAPPANHVINVKDLLNTHAQGKTIQIRPIDIERFQLNADMKQRLEKGDVVAYDIDNQSYFLGQTSDNQFIQLGPINSSMNTEPDEELVLLIFYSALAIIILLLLRPVFRDVYHLQNCAVEFGKHPTSQPLTISPSSTVFPLAKALYNMSHQLLEQMRLHKDLASIIAHEVRTPLARMKFVLQKIKLQIDEKDLSRLRSDIDSLEKIAHNYLEFGISQVNDENYLQQISTANLYDELKEQYAQALIEVTFVNYDKKQTFLGHQAQLNLAIVNLVNNAQRYANKTIEVSCSLSNDNIVFSVCDDGPGFNSVKSNEQLNYDHKSFGLGLYIVNQVAIRHKGEFSISTSHLGGAEMILSIPIK